MMRTFLLIIFFAFCATSISSQNVRLELPSVEELRNKAQGVADLSDSDRTIGIGRLYCPVRSPLPLYASEFDTVPFDTIQFKEIEEYLSYKMSRQSGLPLKPFSAILSVHEGSWIIPYSPPELILKVMFRGEDFYIVEVDSETRELAVVKRVDLFYQDDVDWSESEDEMYMLGYHRYSNWGTYLRQVARVRSEELPIYDRPDGKQLDLKNLTGRIIGIEGDWALFLYSDREGMYHHVWFKWTDGHILLPEITEFLYY
ncbi:hypothetical protein [Dysgonomonas sp. 25]|uniref:hypothetical protein n=1 Tax=Dysgonomonas sp. 25 TaxID=2302933 RepID=UPI0013D19271|nr:hypothetical protein [Dysgonomonas sp. 25]